MATATICSYRAQLVKEDSIEFENIPKGSRSNPSAVFELCKTLEMNYEMSECFYVICFNVKNEPVGISKVSQGGLNFSSAHPREVFRPAILLNASSIVLAHNHPSGDPTPSMSDISTTKQLNDAGAIMGINVLDHLIIGAGENPRWLSFKKENLL